MRKFRARIATLILLGAGTVGFAATPAIADTDGFSTHLPAIVDTSSCSEPVLTQALLAWGDTNLYALAPGQSLDSFDGTGWTLRGGASIVPTDLFDGSTGPVLDLPSGSVAISPDVCVNSTYRSARVMVRDVAGSDNVSFYTGHTTGYRHAKSHHWIAAQTVTGSDGSDTWALSDPLNLRPGRASGWQVVRFAFAAGGQGDESQLYNFYLDPYSRG